jgi:hypothetical protein
MSGGSPPAIGARRVWFDLTNEVVGTTGAAYSSAQITNVGGGIYKIAATVNPVAYGSTFQNFVIGLATGDGVSSYAGNGTSGVYVEDAHLRRTPSDSTYLATTTAARYGLPFEWDASGNLQGILVEEARTELCLHNSDLTNAAWTKSNLTTAKTATGPDGVANSATTCTATAANATALQAIT